MLICSLTASKAEDANNGICLCNSALHSAEAWLCQEEARGLHHGVQERGPDFWVSYTTHIYSLLTTLTLLCFTQSNAHSDQRCPGVSSHRSPLIPPVYPSSEGLDLLKGQTGRWLQVSWGFWFQVNFLFMYLTGDKFLDCKTYVFFLISFTYQKVVEYELWKSTSTFYGHCRGQQPYKPSAVVFHEHQDNLLPKLDEELRCLKKPRLTSSKYHQYPSVSKHFCGNRIFNNSTVCNIALATYVQYLMILSACITLCTICKFIKSIFPRNHRNPHPACLHFAHSCSGAWCLVHWCLSYLVRPGFCRFVDSKSCWRHLFHILVLQNARCCMMKYLQSQSHKTIVDSVYLGAQLRVWYAILENHIPLTLSSDVSGLFQFAEHHLLSLECQLSIELIISKWYYI